MQIESKLAALAAQQRYRRRRLLQSPQGPAIRIDGDDVIGFCSNDYLGLAADPRLAEAMIAGVRRWGSGSGAAHLVNGHSEAHHQLELELAEFTGRPRALLFSTGYMANLGLASALVGRGDSVLQDRLNHASLLDAGMLSGARLMRYRHADAEDLERRLAGRQQGEKLVLSDGVFSMDGDIAPVPALADACRRHDALLAVDDAHGIGVLGAHGGGCLEQLGLDTEAVPLLVGTLGKALGSAGAFVAGSETLIEWLIQSARTYIFTTAQPPAVAEATRAALRLAGEEHWRRQHLQRLITRFRHEVGAMGLPLMDSPTPIQPLLVGTDADALGLSEQLYSRGLLVTAIRPPTVAEGSARLRITFSASHCDAQLDRLLQALQDLRGVWPQPTQ